MVISLFLSIVAAAFALSPPVALDPAVPVRISISDGRAIRGDAEGWTREGFVVRGLAGEIAWRDVAPADRFRIWRQFLRHSGHDTLEGWTTLATAFLVLGDDARLSKRALDRVRAHAGREAADATVEAIRAEVAKQMAVLEELATARRKEQLKNAEPHVRVQRDHEWPLRVPDLQDDEAEVVRTLVSTMVEDLGLNPAQSAAFIVFGPGDVRDTALVALKLDELHATFAKFLGADSQINLFPGVAAVVVVPDRTTLRLLAAEQFDYSLPKGSNAALFYRGDTPIVLAVENDELTDIAREVSLAILHAHLSARGFPRWFEAGLSEFVAFNTVKKSTLDATRRGRALNAIRARGSTPSLEDFGPDGLGRDLAFIIVTRMIETDPIAVSRLIHLVKKGQPFAKAFARTVGMSPAAYQVDCGAWFMLND